MLSESAGLTGCSRIFTKAMSSTIGMAVEEHQPWHVPRSIVVIALADIGAETNLDDSCRL